MSLWQQSMNQASLPYQAGQYLVGRKALEEAPVGTRYELLRALYHNNGLYDETMRALKDDALWSPVRKPLANPTNSIVRFYGAKLLAGPPLEIVAENERIIEPIEQGLWRWSNFDSLRVLLARQNAMLGDSFVQVSHKPVDPDMDRVEGNTKSIYFNLLNPAHVRAFDVDERGFIEWIRIDVPQQRRDADGRIETFTHVAVWSKADGTYRRWDWDSRRGSLQIVAPEDLSRLGPPDIETPLERFGFDFIPIVHVPFMRQDDTPYGSAAVWDSIEHIVELDLIVTELHRKYYGYDVPSLVLYSPGRDKDGRPIPPVAFKDAVAREGQTGDEIVFGRERVYRLPGGWELKYLVPDLDFAAGSKMIEDYDRRIERRQPELIYTRMAELGSSELSGRAIRFLFTAAIDRALEARGNLEYGVVRMQQMGLTMMQVAGLLDRSIGTFEAGAFEHTFKDRDIIPLSDLEEAEAEQMRAQAFTTATGQTLPFTEGLQRIYGYTEEQTADLALLAAAEIERTPVVTQSEEDEDE